MLKNRLLINFILFIVAIGIIFMTFAVFEANNAQMRDYEKVHSGLSAVAFLVVPVLAILFGALAAIGLNPKLSYGQRFNRSTMVTGLILYIVLFAVILLKSI